jgi:hypothetical protein
MSDDEIEVLRKALAEGTRLLFCPYGEVGRDAGELMAVGHYAGNPKEGEDPEPGPVGWLTDGKYVALWNSGPEEWMEVRPLFAAETD